MANRTDRCPVCSSANIRFSRKQSSHDCEECGAVWKDETLVAPLRIFLSYGHDSNVELVHRIKVDLEKRGHDVWFDKSEIKFGDDWRHSITDGILKSNRVLSFLSKHSTREPGVCRDEIAIAIGVKGGNIQTILVEAEPEVQPPVNIGHIQWLDMHDWKEAHGVVRAGKDEPAVGDAAWEAWYQAKFAEIVRVVESEESRRFAGEIETLNDHVKPIRSDARICQLLSKGFYGRQWLFDAVEEWRNPDGLPGSGTQSLVAGHEGSVERPAVPERTSRLFWIMGAPGIGKSAFAAQLVHTRGDAVVAAQFCEWDKADHRNAQRVACSVAFQLATRLPDYRRLLLTLPEIGDLVRKDAAELFDYLLANPLRSVIHGGRERYLIVIDALDEAGEGGRNPLVEMLARNAQRLPEWLGLVVTSRPEFDVRTPLQALNPFPLDTASESNRADIREYLQRELGPQLQNRPETDRLVARVLEKSEGVFLYVERFCDDVRRGYLSLDRPDEIPQGLGGIFCQYFQRQFPGIEKFRRDVRPALRAILAAREPLPVEILQRLFNWEDEELRDFARPLASLFPITTDAGHEVIKPFHKSLADWLGDGTDAGCYYVSVIEGHVLLSDFGWQEYQGRVRPRNAYFIRNLPRHLAEAAQWEALLDLMGDPGERLFQRWAEHGETSDGRRCLEVTIECLTGRGDNPELAAALVVQLARIEMRDGQRQAARDHLRKVLDLGLDSSDVPSVAIAAHEYGSVCLEEGDARQALAWYRRALRAARRRSPPSLPEIAANQVGIASAYQVMHRASRRVELLAKHALTTALQAGDAPHEVAALRLLGDCCKDLMRFDDAEHFLSLGLERASSEGLPFASMALLNARGWALYQRAAVLGTESADASAVFRELTGLAASHRHRRFEIDGWAGVGQCAILRSDCDEAERALARLRGSITADARDHAAARCALLNACLLHRRGDWDGALAGYDVALGRAREARLPAREADALVGRGAVQWHLGRRDEAECDWGDASSVAQTCAPVRRQLVQQSILRCRKDRFATPL